MGRKTASQAGRDMVFSAGRNQSVTESPAQEERMATGGPVRIWFGVQQGSQQLVGARIGRGAGRQIDGPRNGPVTQESKFMESSSHLAALQSKHAGLERQIHEAMKSPHPDLAMIASLKRHKLKIRDMMARH